jgi:signal transduction histidine kinase
LTRLVTVAQGGEQRAAEQAAIADLGLLALGAVAPGELMEAIVERVATTLGARYASIFEHVAQDDRLLLRAGTGWPPSIVGRSTVPAGAGSPFAKTLATGEPYTIGGAGEAPLPDLLRDQGVVSGVTVLVRGRAGPWGVLCAHSDAARRFTAADVDFLQSVANTLAMAREHGADIAELRRRSDEIARLARERLRVVAEALDAEDRARERISQHLHDDLLQLLLVIRQDLAEAKRRPQRDDLVSRAGDRVSEAIRDLRRAVLDLHPAVLERGALQSAISAVAQHHAKLGGFKVDVEVSGAPDGGPSRLLLSLTRELLANVARHAAADHVSVTLRRSDREAVLEVADDGRGMDVVEARGAVARGHIGLASAAHRAEAIGGRVELESRPGEGTTVRVLVPLRGTPGE